MPALAFRRRTSFSAWLRRSITHVLCLIGARRSYTGRWRAVKVPMSFHAKYVILTDLASSSVSPRKRYIMFSTKNPPAVQRIPWPSVDTDTEEDEEGSKAHLTGHDTWILNDEELPWLINSNGILVSSSDHITVSWHSYYS